jgi:hypothetical protein
MIEHPPFVDDAPEHEVGSRSLMCSGGFAVFTPPAMIMLLGFQHPPGGSRHDHKPPHRDEEEDD